MPRRPAAGQHKHDLDDQHVERGLDLGDVEHVDPDLDQRVWRDLERLDERPGDDDGRPELRRRPAERRRDGRRLRRILSRLRRGTGLYDPPRTCETGLCGAGLCVAPECTVDGDCAALDDQCVKGVCDLDTDTCVAQAANEGGACENGDLCSMNDTCSAGTCTPGQMVDCSEFDGPCTVGKCDPDSGSCGLFDKTEGSPCDDGDGCTFNESCMQGNCLAPAGEGAIFYADFSTAAGWTLPAPWEIGPAKTSPSGTGGADPGTDHSPTDDNGVAGTVIGGLESMGVHGPLCLTSPSFDSTNNNGTLWLSFWRHLHSPASAAVVNRIEIWNGIAWKLVESGYPAVVNDNAWGFQKYNVTGNAAKDFRVRICVERKQGAPNYAGWSLDDLVVASSACTP